MLDAISYNHTLLLIAMRHNNVANTGNILLRPKRNLDRQKYLRVSDINPYQCHSLVPRESILRGFAASVSSNFRLRVPGKPIRSPLNQQERGVASRGTTCAESICKPRERDCETGMLNERTNERGKPSDRAREKEVGCGKNEITAGERSNFPYS